MNETVIIVGGVIGTVILVVVLPRVLNFFWDRVDAVETDCEQEKERRNLNTCISVIDHSGNKIKEFEQGTIKRYYKTFTGVEVVTVHGNVYAYKNVTVEIVTEENKGA